MEARIEILRQQRVAFGLPALVVGASILQSRLAPAGERAESLSGQGLIRMAHRLVQGLDLRCL